MCNSVQKLLQKASITQVAVLVSSTLSAIWEGLVQKTDMFTKSMSSMDALTARLGKYVCFLHGQWSTIRNIYLAPFNTSVQSSTAQYMARMLGDDRLC